MMTTNTTLDKRSIREFGFVMAGGLILIFGLFFPWVLERDWPQWPWVAGAVFASLGVVFPAVLAPIQTLWVKIGHVLGWVNSRIILGVIFFVIFLPAALIMRVLSHDPMKRRLDKDTNTYRITSEHQPRERMEKPF